MIILPEKKKIKEADLGRNEIDYKYFSQQYKNAKIIKALYYPFKGPLSVASVELSNAILILDGRNVEIKNQHSSLLLSIKEIIKIKEFAGARFVNIEIYTKQGSYLGFELEN